jgi:hypothetical protein
MPNVKFSELPVKTAAQSTASQIFFPVVEMDGTPANFRISVVELDTLIGAGDSAPSPGPGSDITINPSTGAWTINNTSVTYTKLQNVSQTLRILGRQSAGAGPVEEITVTATGLSLINQASTANVRTFLGLGSAALRDETYFALSGHTHSTADITSGVFPAARLGTGTPTSTTFLNGAGQWSTPSFADGDYDDILVSSNGTVFNFNPEVVSLFARGLLNDVSAAAARATLGITELSASAFGQSMITAADAAAGTALLNTFASTLKGLVPSPGAGVTTTFLRADGTWANPTAVLAAGSVTTTILADTAVTNPKLASMAAYTLKGNASAVSAQPADLTGTQATTLLDPFTQTLKGLVPPPGNGVTTTFLRADGTWATPAGATVANGDYGDITVTNSGATWTIDSQAVTYAKIQNVSATDRILGRSSAGAGVIQEITCTAFARTILDDASAADVRTTLATNLAENITSGIFAAARLGTGTADNTKYLRGDGVWAAVTATATPAGNNTEIQFNDAGALGSDANFTWSGSELFVGRSVPGTGGRIRIESGTGSVPAPLNAAFALVQTWEYGVSNAITPIQVQITDTSSGAGSQIQRFSVGVNIVSSVQKDGLTWGKAGFRCESASTSGYTFLDGTGLYYDAESELGQRDSLKAQRFSVYNKFDAIGPNPDYERAVFDWRAEPGVLRIGTEKAGNGLARGLKIVTDGAERIEVTSTGSIQFYNAYTFPSGAGTSGQVLQTNGAGTLSWATVSGGSATPSGSDTQVQYNSSGSFAGSSNLTFDGTVLKTAGYAINSSALIASAATSLSLSSTHNGRTIVFSSNSPITVTVPTGLGAGFCVTIIQSGTGAITFTASGTTINSFQSLLSTAGQHASASLLATAADVFNLSGALA